MTLKSALKVGLAFITVLLVVCLAAFAWMKLAPRRVPDGQPPLATIGPESLAGFRATFNEGEGEIRVLALLSPT